MTESEITPTELAGLVDALGLTPGYSMTTGRGYVELDGEVLYANLTGVRLPPEVPGMVALQTVRLIAFAAAVEQQEQELLATMTDEQRDRYAAEKHRAAMQPDPPQWRIDALQERTGQSELHH